MWEEKENNIKIKQFGGKNSSIWIKSNKNKKMIRKRDREKLRGKKNKGEKNYKKILKYETEDVERFIKKYSKS